MQAVCRESGLCQREEQHNGELVSSFLIPLSEK